MNKMIVLAIGIPAMFVWLIRHSLHKDARWTVPEPVHVESASSILTFVYCESCDKVFRLRSQKIHGL